MLLGGGGDLDDVSEKPSVHSQLYQSCRMGNGNEAGLECHLSPDTNSHVADWRDTGSLLLLLCVDMKRRLSWYAIKKLLTPHSRSTTCIMVKNLTLSTHETTVFFQLEIQRFFRELAQCTVHKLQNPSCAGEPAKSLATMRDATSPSLVRPHE